MNRTKLIPISGIIIFLLILIYGFSVRAFNVSASPQIQEKEAEVVLTSASPIVFEPDSRATEKPQKESEPDIEYLGEFTATAYCGCDLCNGGKYQFTYTGSIPKENHTVAADLNIFSIGDELMIKGQPYQVEDRLSSDGIKRINIYFEDHEEALNYGIQKIDVYRTKKSAPSYDSSSLGEFVITGYCSCEICCEAIGDQRLTFSETKPKANHTIAADITVLPLGTQLQIDGIIYTVEDTGSSIIGNRLDIYFDTHEEATLYGRRNKEVFLY